MTNKTEKASADGTMLLLLIFLNTLVVKTAYIQNSKWYLALFITIPLLLVTLFTQEEETNN